MPHSLWPRPLAVEQMESPTPPPPSRGPWDTRGSKAELCVLWSKNEHSPVPVTASKQGAVTDGLGATQRVGGGTPPPPSPALLLLWGSFSSAPFFPSPIRSLSSSPLSLFLMTSPATRTPPQALLSWGHWARRRFTFLVAGLDRTQTPGCSVRGGGEGQLGLVPVFFGCRQLPPTPEPRR